MDHHIPSENSQKEYHNEIKGMTFTKNFRSASAEEWYVFLPSYQERQSSGAAGKVIIHYNLYGNRDVFINTTIIWDDTELYHSQYASFIYILTDEIINRLVGFANTLVSVHAGKNSYQAEFISNDD
ncbi:hypothetical protein [Oceanobacillus halotolerans]|uniref:hypothetical protein n=1 Tax=Oceanobacillus halotolerans TaxID=2663380 RepID=UPI0013DC17A5|nr:hypothetical protein [Oceanobacillus halotolerans]